MTLVLAPLWPSSLLSSKYSNHTALDLPYFSSLIFSKGPNPQIHFYFKFLGLELKKFREKKIQNLTSPGKLTKMLVTKQKKNGGKLKVKKNAREIYLRNKIDK